MDQNIVVMIDEEVERLRQARDILATFLPAAKAFVPLLNMAMKNEKADAASAEMKKTQEPEAAPADKVRKSRRGIRTGPRGPRLSKFVVTPRALDSKVPTTPVVVAPSARPMAAPPTPPRVMQPASVDKLDSLLAAAFASM